MVDWQSGIRYRISTDGKKLIEQISTYAKISDYDQKITHKENFRSGWVEVLGDDMSYYLDDSYDPDIGTDVWIFPTEDHEILDGVADDVSFSENISEGGIFISTESPPSVGDSLEVDIPMIDGSQTVTIKGIVRWHRIMGNGEASGCGVQFTEVPEGAEKHLENMITLLQKEPLFIDL